MNGVGVFQKGLLNELSQEYAKISKSEPGIWGAFYEAARLEGQGDKNPHMSCSSSFSS